MAKFTLPALPYADDALEPVMSRETIEYHHGKHHKAYVDKLNELVVGTRFENLSLEQIVMGSEGALFNNAAQNWNHTYFFGQFSPKPQSAPTGEFARAIDAEFGSLDKLKEQMAAAGVGQFGSGWAWLVKDDAGKLSVIARPNAANPMTEGLKPLLTMDVWEHAYYIDYRNRRADFLKALWNIVDWKVIEQSYAAK